MQLHRGPGVCQFIGKNRGLVVPPPHKEASQLPRTANPVQALELGLKLKAVERMREAGQLAEAARACNDILRTDPHHAGALYTMGMLALELGALDIAIGSFERAAVSAPGTVRILLGLGQAQAKAGQPVKASATYARALKLAPNSGAAYRGLGLVQLDLDQREQATKSFRKAQKLSVDDAFSAYMLAALGDGAAVPRPGYVLDLFDSYADQFDRHLTEGLGYRIPQEIAAMVAAHVPSGALAPAVDLGCGTGLVGVALAGQVAEIDGMDLSPKMLAKAAARGLYRRLREGDVTALLTGDPDFAGPYALATAADVFIYIGRLEGVFAAVRARLAPGGLFVFSVESSDAAEVEIRSSGRFAHSAAYVAGLADSHGFSVVDSKALIVRKENETPIPGVLHVLRGA